MGFARCTHFIYIGFCLFIFICVKSISTNKSITLAFSRISHVQKVRKKYLNRIHSMNSRFLLGTPTYWPSSARLFLYHRRLECVRRACRCICVQLKEVKIDGREIRRNTNKNHLLNAKIIAVRFRNSINYLCLIKTKKNKQKAFFRFCFGQ